MTTIDITRHMTSSRYGEADQWVTADQYSSAQLAAGDWIELRMHSRYTRRTERFTVLYQGPGGQIRTEHGGPQHPGPIGSLICQASIIASAPVARARYLDVQVGDVLVIHGQRMVIVDDDPHGYPDLITEVELGIRTAMAHVRDRMLNEAPLYPDASTTGAEFDQEVELANARRRAIAATLADLYRELRDLAPAARLQASVEQTR